MGMTVGVKCNGGPTRYVEALKGPHSCWDRGRVENACLGFW